ncbi:MAG: molybdopterin-dependent oxidoreductase [Deltaproteobacteria bacterium]|nr:molybdopterin-dependent oxidoreductase [Deltaproteobacteria bacterium]
METKEGTYLSSCGLDCGSRCILKVRVEGGRVTRITTDDQPGPGLKACVRGLGQREVLYAEDRLTVPLKRTGPRGSGQFAPVSWEEALNEIAGKLQRVKEQHGPQSVFLMGYSGSFGALHNTGRTGTGRRFFSLFGGCTTTWGSTSAEAALFASMTTFGTPFNQNSRDNLLHSKLIILWGWNPLETRFGPDTLHYLMEAKKKGTRILCVDPRFNPTAKLLEAQWIPIRPATDTALLLAMAQVLIDEERYDHRFIETHTFGFEVFKDYVMGLEDGQAKTPAWAEPLTGVPAQTIVQLAREYVLSKPAALCSGWAAGRTAYGEQFHRAAITLAAMTGNIGVIGGHVAGGTDFEALGALPGLPMPKSRFPLVHVSELYDLLLKGQAGGFPSDVKVLYILGCNLLNQWQNINKGIKALECPELIVVHDLFMTPTARFADFVLPVAHFLERQDIGQPWVGGPYNIVMEKAVEPRPQVKSDLAIFTELASRLGIAGYNEKTEEQWLREFVSAVPGFPNYDELMEKKIHFHPVQSPRVAFQKEIADPANHRFGTPSGKIEIYSQKIAEMQNPVLPPVPKYIEPWEGPLDLLAQDYPFQLISPHARTRINSSLDNIPKLKALADDDLWLNPADAAKLGVSPGEEVRIYNERGAMIRRAKVTERIRPGVVSLDAGAWYRPDEQGVDLGGCVNILTIDKKSPAGAFPCNSCLVQISRHELETK